MTIHLETDTAFWGEHGCLNLTKSLVSNESGEGCGDDISDYSIFVEYWYIFFIRDIMCIPPTILGNILMLVALARFRGLCRGAQGVLFGNLAVSDLLLGVLVFPMDIALRVNSTLIRSVNYCFVYFTVIYIVVGASVLNLFLLSFERFYAIITPLRHLTVVTKRRVYVIIMCIWCSMLSFGLLPLFGLKSNENIVDEIFPVKRLINGTYLYILNTMVVVTMFLNTVFFFIIAYIVLKKNAARMHSINNGRTSSTSTRRDLRHTSVTLILSGLFIVFWGPFCVLSLIPNHNNSLETVHIMFGNLGMINSSINWIVYGCRSKKFRLAFKNTLLCRCRSRYMYNQNESISRVCIPNNSTSFQLNT